MNKPDKTRQQLLDELQELTSRMMEAQETLRAIQSGEVDGLVVKTAEGDRVFTLSGADHPYRVMIETMNEGAVTLAADGTIFFCNQRFADIVREPLEKVTGSSIYQYFSSKNIQLLEALFTRGLKQNSKLELAIKSGSENYVPVLLSVSSINVPDIPGTVCLVVTDLTEQKRNEEILAEGKLTSQILYQAAEIFILCDAQGRIARASQSTHRLFGRSPIFQAFDEAFNLCYADGTPFVLLAAIKDNSIHAVEVTFKNIDNESFSFLLSANSLITKKDAISIIVVMVDVTSRKKAEEKIEHLASFPELNPNPVIEMDLKGQVFYHNPATMMILKELNVPEDVHLFFPPDLNKIIEKLKQGNDGQYLSCDVGINGRVFAENIILFTKLKVVRIYAQEITRRKQVEDKLRQSEEYFKEITENSSDVIIITDKKGNIKYCSRSIERFSGYKPEELIGRSGFTFIHPDDVKRAVDDFGKAILAVDTAIPNEFRLVRKDGSTGYFGGLGKNLLDNPAVAGFVMNIRDINERKMMEKALQKAHDELEQQVEERTLELKTALAEIQTMKDKLEAENIYFRNENKMNRRFEHILGQSDGLKYVLYRAEQVALANTTVLILGETGTGKELIAAAIHNMSSRKERPLITVNCASLPANLIESELFGREKGAFTGADIRRVGRFEIAHGSTLCLDEIGELPLEVQAKLLRVIQHNEFERLGSSHTVKVDVRIVATTNRNLEEEARNGDNLMPAILEAVKAYATLGEISDAMRKVFGEYRAVTAV